MNNNILYSCNSHIKYEEEQIIDEHILVYVISGTLDLTLSRKKITLKKNEIALLKRNQLVRAKKHPTNNGIDFQSIRISIKQSVLRTYALKHKIENQPNNTNNLITLLKNNIFLKTYFSSLSPYISQPEKLTNNLSELKTIEAIELLLDLNCKAILFNFSEPHKINIEKYMLENYKFNVQIKDFARLTGRSLSTFKRDFKKLFNTTPQRWLTDKRLLEANYLIAKKNKRPSEIYLELGFENFSHFSKVYNEQFS